MMTEALLLEQDIDIKHAKKKARRMAQGNPPFIHCVGPV
jgi:hypothetical protein